MRYADGQVPAVTRYVNPGTTSLPPLTDPYPQQVPVPVQTQVMPKMYSMKRVITPPTQYSPLTTPPMKIMQGNQGQRMITKTVNGTSIKVIPKDHGDLREACPLTPPPTPQAETCQ